MKRLAKSEITNQIESVDNNALEEPNSDVDLVSGMILVKITRSEITSVN